MSAPYSAEDHAVAVLMASPKVSPAARRKIAELAAGAARSVRLAADTVEDEPVGALAHLIAAREAISEALRRAGADRIRPARRPTSKRAA